MSDDDLKTAVAELRERVSRLEQQAAVSARGRVVSLPPSGEVGERHLSCEGAGSWDGESHVAWRMEREWDEVVDDDPEAVARVLAGLASPHRIRILQHLLRGPATTAELASRLDAATSGQLFHHVKELLATGLVRQPRRGTYATTAQQVVPLLVVIAAARDVATAIGSEEP